MTTTVVGYARSSLEVRFWLRLRGCPRCGERDLGETQLRNFGRRVDVAGQPSGAIMGVTCPRCGLHREVEFYMHPDFHDSAVVKPGDLGGAMPSTIITPVEFATEMQRALAHVPPDFEHLDDHDQDTVAEERAQAYDSAVELLKFIPQGADELPDSVFGTELAYKRDHAAILTRAYLEEKVRYLADYLERMRELNARKSAAMGSSTSTEKRRLPIPAFSLASLKLHEQWVREGDKGENQPLIALGADATEMKLSARNLSRATMEKVTLDRADLSYAALDGARLVQVSLRGASLENASAYEATFLSCQFEGVNAFLFKLRATQFDRCDFTGAHLERSVWTQCTVTNTVLAGADLRNARLDEALFVDCDLRDADLSVAEPGVNTARGARFVRCDLRGSKWTARDLEGVEFSDCQLEGSGLEPGTVGGRSSP